MVQVGIMIEGQNGVNWGHLQPLVHTDEEAGYFGIFRSDRDDAAPRGSPPTTARSSLAECVAALKAAGYAEAAVIGSVHEAQEAGSGIVTKKA